MRFLQKFCSSKNCVRVLTYRIVQWDLLGNTNSCIGLEKKSSKGEIESVTLPADRACFKHKILVDEELGTVPMVLQVLTRSRRKAASESDPLRSQILNHSITKLCWLRTRYLKKALKLLGYQKTQFWKAL